MTLEPVTMSEPADTMSEPADHRDPETERVRQGTGPRATVSVLLASILATAIIGAAIVGYFVLSN